jgi:hypothetical protein
MSLVMKIDVALRPIDVIQSGTSDASEAGESIPFLRCFIHAGGKMELLGAIIALVLVIVLLWRICTRAGFNGELSLLVLIPWLGVVIVGTILSFANWPTKANAVKEQ